MNETRVNRPFSWPGIAIGLLAVVAVIVAAVVLYFQELKPRLTAEQEQVSKSYTFTMLCRVQQPITGIFQGWLIGKPGANAWTYSFACLVESKDDIEIISNGVANLLPEPQPGLHFITIADSAPTSIIDWELEFREKGLPINDPNTIPPTKLTGYEFSHPNFRVYMLNLKPEFAGEKIKVLCREAIDQSSDNLRDWRPYYLCSSN